MSNVTTYALLSHLQWDCKYHIVFDPKCSKQALYMGIRKFLCQIFHELASQRGSKIIKGKMVQDHMICLY